MRGRRGRECPTCSSTLPVRRELDGVAAARSRGRHTRSSSASAPIEQSAAIVSVSSGPIRFETTNCAAAKLTPATSTAGNTPSIPRQPDRSTTRYAGMMTEKNGNWRPTMAESAIVVDSTSRPRIGASSPPSVVTGMPSDPNATGAVLATSASTAALMGSNPSPTSIEAVMATGAPNPAIPSTSAPNPNATSSASKPPVRRQVRQRSADDVEIAAGHRQVVEEDRAEDDPADRPQAERHALRDGRERQRSRHAPHGPREGRGGPGRRHRGLPGRPAQHREQDGDARGAAGPPRCAEANTLPATGS